MNNNQWKHQYFESISTELPTNIFRSLEIELYLQKTFKNHGFSLQNYQINFSKSVINILLSVCKLKQPKLKLSLSTELNKKNSLEKLPIKKKYLQMVTLCKNSRLKFEAEKLKTIGFTNLSNKIAKSLKIFTKNKQNINITIKEVNFVNANPNSERTLENLYKFRKAFFLRLVKEL